MSNCATEIAKLHITLEFVSTCFAYNKRAVVSILLKQKSEKIHITLVLSMYKQVCLLQVLLPSSVNFSCCSLIIYASASSMVPIVV